jgi:hypothetical protein
VQASLRSFNGGFAERDRGAVQIDHAGQLRDLSAMTQCPVLLQGGMPEAVGHGPDSAADRRGDGVSDREEGADSSFPQGADMGEEGFRGFGAVGADEDEDVDTVPVDVGDLPECLVEHSNVIGGGVGVGVPGPRQRHQLLAARTAPATAADCRPPSKASSTSRESPACDHDERSSSDAELLKILDTVKLRL